MIPYIIGNLRKRLLYASNRVIQVSQVPGFADFQKQNVIILYRLNKIHDLKMVCLFEKKL